MYPEDAALYVMTKKKSTVNWTGGRDGAPELNYPYHDQLPAAGSASLATAWGQPQTNNTLRIAVQNPGRFWQTPHIDWEALTLTGEFDAQQLESVQHPKRFAQVMSFLCWQNGGGAIARGSGAGAALTGATVTIRNSQCMKMFVGDTNTGDRIQFSTTDGLTGTLKAYVGRVTAVNYAQNTLTVSPAIVGGDGILDNDFIFFENSHTNNSAATRMFRGLAAWNPITHAEAITTLHGMTRADNVTKRSGWREVITATDDPWDVLQEMMRLGQEQTIRFKDIFVTPKIMERLTASSRETHLRVVGPGRSLVSSRRPLSYDKKGNPLFAVDRMSYGIEGIEVLWPAKNMRCRVYADNYLIDISSTSDNDVQYRALNVDEFGCALNAGAPTWWNTDRNGPWYWIQGTETIGAVYGAIGQFYHLAPANTIVMSPNATIS